MKDKAYILIAAQYMCVYLYIKYGYDDTAHAYEWGLFFHVSNQLILTRWAFLYLKTWKNAVILLNLGLSVLWANKYIPIVACLVNNYGMLIAVISVITCSLLIDILLILTKRK